VKGKVKGALIRLAAVSLAATLAGCAGTPPPAAPAGPGAFEVRREGPHLPPEQKPDFWAGRTDLIKSPPPPKPIALVLPKLERFTLPNGLEVLIVARKDLPVASFGLAIQAGGYDESRETLGVSDFAAAMLRLGTKTRSAEEISRAIDFVGGSLGAQSTNEGTTATCSALSKDSQLCLDLLADIVLHPSFPEAEMADVRDQMLAMVAQRYDSPHELAAAHFDALLFGDKHPEGWVLTAADVKRIDRAALESFWKTFYRPNHAIMAIAGDVDAVALRTAVSKAFGGWERATVPARPELTVPPIAGLHVRLVDRPDLTQATIMLGHPGIKHADPRWYAATLVNYVLGGSDFSSRLMTEVRSKRGLTYGIGSSFGASLYQGAFRISASTKNESTWEALQASIEEMRRMKTGGPSALELDKAKGFYAGSYPFSLQSAAGVAAALVGAELHGLGDDYVRELPVRLAAVDVATAVATGQALLHPDTLQVVIVGKGDAIAPQLTKAGVSYERIGFKSEIKAALAPVAKTK
jgi:zinc protease